MTIKELAAELNTSKTTIKNIIKRLGIEPQKKLDRGQEVIFLTESEIEKIKTHYFEKHPAENTENFTGNTENFTENVSGKSEKVSANTEKSTEKAESLGVTERLVELLQQDLESKNKQIDDLNNRLAEAMKALDQEQQLKALAERRILELEDKAAATQETAAEAKETKKGFFSWFGKK